MRYERPSGRASAVSVDHGATASRVKGNVRYEPSLRARDKTIHVGVNIFRRSGDGPKSHLIDRESSETRTTDDAMWHGETDVCDFAVKDAVYDEAQIRPRRAVSGRMIVLVHDEGQVHPSPQWSCIVKCTTAHTRRRHDTNLPACVAHFEHDCTQIAWILK